MRKSYVPFSLKKVTFDEADVIRTSVETQATSDPVYASWAKIFGEA